MRPFVFSCDAHVAEPPDLFTRNMPAHLQDWAIRAMVEDGFRLTKIGDRLIMKMRTSFNLHRISPEQERRGARDLTLRLKDMDKDGVDAELCFPSLGLVACRIEDREAALCTARIYNDWLWDYVADHRDRLVPVALLPVWNLEDTLAELKRCVAKGYAAAMLPPVLPDSTPKYNQPVWDPIFAYAGEHEVPLIFHTGTGYVNIRALKGPGGAVFNYTRQMNDSVDVIAALVGGGVLDRNPAAHILFVEHGAGWLMGLAERMDEVYHGHATAVEPKLARLPSQIVRDQVHCTFQNDIGCLVTRKKVGVGALLFATDYPHAEGTFPYSQDLVAHMFDDVPEMGEEERQAVLGLNAVRLFKHAPVRVPAAAAA